jgi:hypothetical protein
MSMSHDHVDADAGRIMQPNEKAETVAGGGAAPGHLSPAGVIGMQQAAGNRGTRAAVGGARGDEVQRIFGLPFGGPDPTMGGVMGGMNNPTASLGGAASQFGGGAIGYGQQQATGALGGLGLPPQLMAILSSLMGSAGGMATGLMGQGINQGMGAMGGVPGMGAGGPMGAIGGMLGGGGGPGGGGGGLGGMIGGLGHMLGGLF